MSYQFPKRRHQTFKEEIIAIDQRRKKSSYLPTSTYLHNNIQSGPCDEVIIVFKSLQQLVPS